MSEEVFADILIKAVEYDKSGKMNEALTCYKEGISLLLKFMKGVNDKNKLAHYQAKVSEYFKRAEDIKEFLKRKKELDNHTHFDIKDGDINYSYKSVLTKYLDPLVSFVKINDPYIRSKHQTYNLLKFIEVLIAGCKNLRKIELMTTTDPKEGDAQLSRINNIKINLKRSFNIELDVNFSNTLHDRSIILNNGWCIKIGRGLDYFHPCDCWCPGYFDLDLRTCRETSVDIFYQPECENG